MGIEISQCFVTSQNIFFFHRDQNEDDPGKATADSLSKCVTFILIYLIKFFYGQMKPVGNAL